MDTLYPVPESPQKCMMTIQNILLIGNAVISLLPFCDSEHEEDISSEVTDNFCVKDKPKINKPPKYSIAGKGFKFAHLNVVSLVKNFEEM